jgi:hypothetical protein
MAPTLAPEHWGVHGGAPPDSCGGGFERYCNGTNVVRSRRRRGARARARRRQPRSHNAPLPPLQMAQRNYPCDNIILQYFGPTNFDAVGEAAFKKDLWQCMLGQALLLKSVIEVRRSTNQYGHLIWQLNEIWPTGGCKFFRAISALSRSTYPHPPLLYRGLPRVRHNWVDVWAGPGWPMEASALHALAEHLH